MQEDESNFRKEVEAESSDASEVTSDKNRATFLARHLASTLNVPVENYRENSGDSSTFEFVTDANDDEIADGIRSFFEPLGFLVEEKEEARGIFLPKKVMNWFCLLRWEEAGRRAEPLSVLENYLTPAVIKIILDKIIMVVSR